MASTSLMIGPDHRVPVLPLGGTATVTVDNTGGTVYWVESPQGSVSDAEGSIAPGGSQAFTRSVYLLASALAGVTISVNSVYDQWAATSPGGVSASVVSVTSGSAPKLDSTAQVDQQVYYYDAASGRIKSKVVSGGGGTSEPFTPVDSLNASPRSVTDWGSIINTWLTSNTKGHLVFGPFDYPYSTKINLANTQYVTFQGAGGLTHPRSTSVHGTAPTRLIWKGGASSGTAIDTGTNVCDGFVLRELGVYYDQAAYDGNLIWFGADRSKISQCEIGRLSTSQSVTARSLIVLDGGVGNVIESNSLESAVHGTIRGFDTVGQGVCDDHTIRENNFNEASTASAYILNPGIGMVIRDNRFGMGFGASPQPPAVIGWDIAKSATHLVFNGNRVWDASGSPGTQAVISQPSTVTINGLEFTGNFIQQGGVPALALNGPIIGFQISGNTFQQTLTAGQKLIDLGSNSTAQKQSGDINSNFWTTNASTAMLVSDVTGHQNVQVVANTNKSNPTAVSRERRVLYGHEYLGYANSYSNMPALAAHAGITLTSASVNQGTDAAGIVVIQNGASPIAAQALFADLTLATANEHDDSSQPGLPLVIVSAGVYSAVAGAAVAAATVAAGIFFYVSSGSNVISFGTANGIAANATVMFSYRLIFGP